MDDRFKPHKIPGIDKNICNAEQKIAYNFLFIWADGCTGNDKNYSLNCIQRSLSEGQKTTFKRYDVDLIYHYIVSSWDRYKNSKYHIFSSYTDLASIIY